MVLPFKARRTPDPVPDESCLLRDQLAQALQELVSEVCVVHFFLPHLKLKHRHVTNRVSDRGLLQRRN